eukprot:3521610-Heterocapsa_arctica.AAC.1
MIVKMKVMMMVAAREEVQPYARDGVTPSGRHRTDGLDSANDGAPLEAKGALAVEGGVDDVYDVNQFMN